MNPQFSLSAHMCHHNTYIPCYIESEQKRFPQKRKHSKHGLIKKTFTFSRCSLPFHLSLFCTAVRQLLPYIVKEIDSGEELYS